MAKVTIDDVLESVDSWTVLELNKLVKGIEEKYGVSAAAPMGLAQDGQLRQRLHRTRVNQTRAKRLAPLGRRLGPFPKQRVSAGDGVIAKVIVIQDPRLEHRQLLLVLTANPLGSVAD